MPRGLPSGTRRVLGWANLTVDLSGVSSSAATVEAWINSSATSGGSGEVIYLGQDGDGAAPRLSVDAQSRIHVYWSSAGTGGGYASADTLPVLDGTWHHIAVTSRRGARGPGRRTLPASAVSVVVELLTGTRCRSR